MSYNEVVGELTRGRGPGPLARASAGWVLIAEEFDRVADDCDDAVAELKRAGDDDAAHRLERFGRWLRELSMSAAAAARRAENASVAHSVSVLRMPAETAAGEADDRAVAQVMRDYDRACRASIRPWRTPQPPGGPGRK
ncbi:PPE domain-containing protein [Mycolicibacterium flavescens]|uniref:PPE domain-containing protein n=1 Tax=Mycolicibacterium flavescens TaxID=1776 RepID=A0A1E3RNP1_MYCFV|nr:PPE domain-containing protein [Mycolicibacterium flavescens]MCV7278226.1 PPE domain-containing protein [Mycolicibacterium flavescens]ODQ91488.1 hypothetical protein BHQ18_05190 [Mycolicibacterium flavescens]